MPVNIIEIKARCKDPHKVHQLLRQHQADFRGEDHQIDTYFKTPIGRLKLREGNIENNLIHYNRPNISGPKNSKVTYSPISSENNIKSVLTAAMGVLTVVDKKRSIYFIENVKFHIDEVKQLGTFVEIEAIDETGKLGLSKLQEQCQYFMELLAIQAPDLMETSYSDMLLL